MYKLVRGLVHALWRDFSTRHRNTIYISATLISFNHTLKEIFFVGWIPVNSTASSCPWHTGLHQTRPILHTSQKYLFGSESFSIYLKKTYPNS